MIELRQLAAFMLATQAQSDVRGFGYTRDVFITDLDVHDPCAPMLLHGCIYIYKPCWFRGDCFNRPTRFQSTPRYLNISSSRDIYMYIHFGLGYLSVLRSFGTFQRVSRRFNKNRINVLLSKWKGKISFIALYFRTQLGRKNIVNRLK